MRLGVLGVIFYLHFAFVRRKPNKSRVVSVQVIDKSSARYNLIKTIGSSSNETAIARLIREGELWIKHTSTIKATIG